MLVAARPAHEVYAPFKICHFVPCVTTIIVTVALLLYVVEVAANLVSIVVPFSGLVSFICRIPQGNATQELHNYNGDREHILSKSDCGGRCALTEVMWVFAFLVYMSFTYFAVLPPGQQSKTTESFKKLISSFQLKTRLTRSHASPTSGFDFICPAFANKLNSSCCLFARYV